MKGLFVMNPASTRSVVKGCVAYVVTAALLFWLLFVMVPEWVGR